MTRPCGYCGSQVSEKDWKKGWRECKGCYLERHIAAGWRAEDINIRNIERTCEKCNTSKVSVKEWSQGIFICKACRRKAKGWKPNSKRKSRKKRIRCVATTAQGRRCRNKAKSGGIYCKAHAKKHTRVAKVAGPTKDLANFLGSPIRVAPQNERFKTRKGELYEKYLRTNHWKQVRKEVRSAWKTCRLCNKNSKEMHIHHTSYRNIWEERWGDLTLLCKRCHNKYHEKEKL